MGVSHRVRDNLLMIGGPTRWQGAEVNALDLRAGAALMLAGMMADGQTRIENFWQIERGYGDLFAKLANLGVDFSLQSSS
jgi:UDP-N-acetylglucosamine 1-carboxyvinyltransferase